MHRRDGLNRDVEMKTIRTSLMTMAAGFMTAALVCGPGTARADGPRFTIVNNSQLTVDEAQFYYLGVGMNKVTNQFLVLMQDGSWAPAGSKGTHWNANGFNPNGPPKNKMGAGVVPCHKLVTRIVNGTPTLPTVTVPTGLVGARIYFFMARPGQPWFSTVSGGDFTNKCDALPVIRQTSKKNQKANGIFGNVFTAGVGGSMPFSYFSKTGNGNYNGASPASIIQNALPLYTFSEAAGASANPKVTTKVADIDASQVDLVSFPTNIIAQVDQGAIGPGTSVPTEEGVGFSFSPNGEVNKQAMITSFTDFAQGLAPTEGQDQAQDYANLKVTAPNNGGEFLVNPGNYLSNINPTGTTFSQYFLPLVNDYLWNPTLHSPTSGWTGKIDLGGAFQVKGYPVIPQLVMTGEAVDLNAGKTQPFPGYSGSLPAIRFKATVNGKTFIAYVLSPVSYATLCGQKLLKNCSALTPAYQIFAGDGALSATGTGQFKMLKRLHPNAASLWSRYDGVGGSKAYNLIVARLGLILSNAFNRGVAGGLPTGLCADAKYQGNISYCWSDQANWYPNGAGVDPSDFHNGDTTQNQFARWLHTSAVARSGGGAPIPVMTQPSNTITTQSGDVMGMAYGFGYDENPTPQLPGATGQQTPAEYSSNVLTGANSSPTKNCITIMPYGSGTTNPVPPSGVCAP